MKKNILYTLAIIFALYSCSEKDIVDQHDEKEFVVSNIQATIKGFEAGQKGEIRFGEMYEQANIGATTRSAFKLEGSALKFKWQEDDQLAIFANKGNDQSLQLYSINRDDIGEPSATFSSETFQMSSRYSYFAFSNGLYTTPDTRKERVILDYSGQRQTANNNTDHLGRYNYMASYQKPNLQQNASFAFKNLSEPMRIRIYLPNGGKFTKFEVLRADGETIKYSRLLDLTDGTENIEENGNYNDYAPKSEPNDVDEGKHSYELLLGAAGSSEGIQPGETDKLLRLWMMFPVTDELKNEPLIGKLTGKVETSPGNWENKIYYVTMTGYEFDGGTYGTFDKIPTESTKLNVSLRVNKLWQVGNTQSQTRAGDPGVDDKLLEPEYVYIFTCKNDHFLSLTKVKKDGVLQTVFDGATTSDPSTTWQGWTETTTKTEWRYNKTFTIDLTADAEELAAGKSVDVFAIASYNEIDVSAANSWTTTTEQSTVEAFTYSVTDDDAGQTKLKNLYSYSFKRNKGEDMVVPATLYHTCAKLDVQWNNKTASALTGNVSVNNVPTSGLKMFTPTANVAGSWAPSTAITHGTEWNGRTVFYVPQLNPQTYNITTGTSHTQDITFTAPADEMPTGTTICAKTAWFKANITINPAP